MKTAFYVLRLSGLRLEIKELISQISMRAETVLSDAVYSSPPFVSVR